MRSPAGTPLLAYYRTLFEAYGPQGWWPARTPFEVIVGAILTQGVAWSNVEKAIAALRREGMLDPARMRRASRARLAALIRPAGYYNQKAAKLGALLRLLERPYGASLRRLLAEPADALRKKLLDVPGIGPETADSIVLYAAGRTSFVVDAYTRRILMRHGLLEGGESYEEVRHAIESSLPRKAALYNEYHALLVRVGKEHCVKRTPRCRGCPLERHLRGGDPVPDAPRRTVCRTSAGSRRRAARRPAI
jgi:endonuclease-3 related protein